MLSIDQLKSAIDHFEIQSILKSDFFENIKKPGKYDELFPTELSWSEYYEIPFKKLVVYLHEKAEYVYSKYPKPIKNEECLTLTAELFNLQFAALFSFDCLLLYGEYLNDFVAKAQHGDDAALLKGIRIDPLLLTGPTATKRLARAVITDDTPFLSELRLAMSGKTGKQANYLKKCRFILQVLHENNSLNHLTAEIADVLISLGAYSDSPNSQKNLDTLVRKFRQLKTISK